MPRNKPRPPGPPAFSVAFELTRDGAYPCVTLRPGEGIGSVSALSKHERTELLANVASILRGA